MGVEWKAGNEGWASMGAGGVLTVPSMVSGVDPHSETENHGLHHILDLGSDNTFQKPSN